MQKFLRRRSGARPVIGVAGALCIAFAITALGSISSAATSHKSTKHLKIAYLSFAVDNSYDAPMLAAATAVADSNNASLTVFDANNSPTTQYAQFQDAIAAGKYQGIITQPIESTNLIPLVKQAVKKGIKVVNIDQILGPKLNTSKVQVAGLSGNVTFVPTVMGQDLGKLTVEACQSKNLSPCNVGYLYDIQASSLDIAIRNGFNSATSGHNINVVATGQDYFTPSLGLTAVQDILTANPSINLIAGSDQGIEGAADDTSRPAGLLLVGYGGSGAGDAGVKAGSWFGTVLQDPATEGRVGVQTLINAIRNHKNYPGVNPIASEPNGGIIVKSDVKKFTAEWPG